MARVRIQLPASHPDPRVTAFRVYRIRAPHPPVVVATVPIGTADAVDDQAAYGDAYFYTALDQVSGNESKASPASRIFRRLSTMPANVKPFSGSVVIA